MIVTVAVGWSPLIMPGRGVKVTVNVSSFSSRLSSVMLNRTQDSVVPAGKKAVGCPFSKSSPAVALKEAVKS